MNAPSPFPRPHLFGSPLLLTLLLAAGAATPLAAQTPAEALDQPSWQFDLPEAQVRPRLRVVTGAASHDGTDALAGDSGLGENPVLSTVVDGPGEFSFWWRSYGQLNTDRMRLTASSQAGLPIETGSNKIIEITGIVPWTRQRLTLPPGRVTLQWTQLRGGIQMPEPVGVWLDQFEFTPSGGPVTVAEGVDNSAIVWTMDGDGEWRGRGTAGGESDYGLFFKPANSLTRLRGTVPAGWFSINYSQNIRLNVPPDGQFSSSAQLPSNWRRYSAWLPQPGEISMEVEGAGAAEGGVDECLTISKNITLGEALEAPQITWTPRPSAAAWKATPLPFDTWDGVDAAVPADPSMTPSLDGALNGPAELRVRVRKVTSTNAGSVQLEGNSNSTDWREQRWLLPPGQQVLTWTGGSLDDVRIAPLEVIPASVATGASALTWSGTNTFPGGWYGVNDAAASHDGNGVLRSGPLSAPRSATAAWSGAGAFRYYSRYNVSVNVDGAFSLSNIAADWRSAYIELPAGDHTASFTASHTSPGTYSELDDVSWTPGSTPWATALDLPSGSIAGSGDALWQVTTSGAYTGGSALASPALKTGQTAKLHLLAAGPGTLKFRWRHQPDSPSRPVAATVSGNGQTCQVNAPFDWQEKSIPLVSGQQTVVWSIVPVSAEGSAAGALVLDNVRIELPYAAVHAVGSEVAAAADLPGQPFTITGHFDGVTASSATESHDGISALQIQTPRPAAVPARLVTTQNGPFELSFWWRVKQGGFFLDIDNVRWLEMNQPAPAAREVSAWRRAVVSVLSPGPHTLTFIDNGSGSFWLDEMHLEAPSSAGTFSAATGGAPLEWAVPDLGTGHALPDPSTPRGISAGAKLGAGTGLFRCRTSGPAILSGWWRCDVPDGRFSILNDFSGEFAARVRAPGRWQQFQVFVPGTGPQWVRWLPQNMSGLQPEAVRLDSLSVAPLRDPAIGEALGSPNLAWSATPQNLWISKFTLNERRLDYVSTSIDPVPEVTAGVTGPGWLSLSYSPLLTFDLDGTVKNGASFLSVPAGEHTARWRLTAAPGTNAVSLRYPSRFIPQTSLSAEAGMDLDESPSVTLLAASGMTGLADAELPQDGEDCAISGPLSASPALVRWSVTGPGRLRFSFAAAGAAARLTGKMDSTTVTQSLAEGWISDEIKVPAGSHEVSVLAEFITGADAPESWLLLDRVRFESDAPAPSLAVSSFDDTGRVWRERAVSPLLVKQATETYPAPLDGTFATALIAPGDSTWLETEVTGPGYVTVRPVNLTATPPFYSASATAGTVEAAWGTNSIVLPAGQSQLRIPESGPQVLRLTFKNGGPSATGSGSWRWFGLDAFHFLPDSAPAPSLGEALDAPSLAWTTTAGHWSTVDYGPFGDYAIASGSATAITRVLGLTLPGPGTLTWSWKLSVSSSNILSLANPRENYVYNTGPQSTNWASSSQFIVPQQQVWEFRAANLSATQFAQLDGVTFTPAPVVSVSEALDLPERTWTLSSPDAWRAIQVPVNKEPAVGGDALLSGVLNHNQSAWFETVVPPPAYVSFAWKANSESADAIRFSINGTVAATNNGAGITATYSTFERHLTGTAPLVLRWTYSKNATVHGGKDTAFLDNMVLTEFPSGDLAAATNASGLTLTTGGSNGYTFLPLSSPRAFSGGSSAAFFGSAPQLNPPSNPQAWIDTTITGPGVLSFAGRGSVDLLVDGSLQGPGPVLTTALERDNWRRTWRSFSDTGTHTVRIRANSPGSLNDPVMVDEMRFDPILPLSAANDANITWNTGSPGWFALGNAANRTLAASVQSTTGSYTEATITGPGLLRFSAGGQGTLSYDGLRLTQINSTPGSGSYSPFGCFIPPGTHTLRLACAGSERLWLYGLSFSPPGGSWLPALLDAPSLFMMSTGPDSYASDTDKPLVTGNPYLAWNSSSAPLDVLLPGNGHVRVSWSQAIPWDAADPPQLSINASTVTPCPLVDEWVASASAEFFAPSLIRLSLKGYAPPDSPATLLRVDGLNFVEANPLSPAAALECPALDGMSLKGWAGQADQALSFDGEDLLVAEMGPLQTTATASASLQGPAVLTFSWRVSSSSSQSLTLSVDGVTFARKATTEWTTMRLEIGAGSHSLVWTAIGNAAGSKAMLDSFTCTPGTPFLDYLSPNLPALFAASSTLSIVTRSGVTGLVQNGTSAAEYLLPGPSITGSPDSTGTLQSHSGLLLKNLSLQTSPPPLPLTQFPVTTFTPVSLAEAMDTGLTLTTSGGWTASSAGQFDFAWVRQSPGSPAQWIETVVHGPGTLSWAGPFSNSGGASLPAAMVDGAPADQGNFVRLTEARDYTVRWSAGSPLNGTLTFALDQLIWAPDTVDTNPALWLESFNLTGPDAALTADPDHDGYSNLMEFAFGGNPSVPGALDVTPLLVSTSGWQFPALSFKRRNLSRLSYQLERLKWNGWQGEQSYKNSSLAGEGPYFPTQVVSGEPLPAVIPAGDPVLLRILVTWSP